MAVKSIGADEWLAELARLSDRSDEGLTALEWAAEMGVEHECALRRLKQAQAAGWLKVGKRQGTTIDGRSKRSPVYLIVKPSPGTGKPKGGKR